jgi:Sulfotransferase domain
MVLSVIGAGFGRTGTFSLKLALEQLGFGPCFHMAEFFISDSAETLQTKWAGVAFGPGSPDWDTVFDGYRATVDWPSCAFYRELAEHYPDAKVILTVRDAERWYDSCAATIFTGPTTDTRTDPWGRMVHKVISEDAFAGNTRDREKAIAVYNRHNETVRTTIPPERLLVYQPGDGWEPLCAFLDVPVPETPFPRANTAEEFQAHRAAEKAAEEEAAKAAEQGERETAARG